MPLSTLVLTIGAKVMAAIADLPGRCGTVMIPAGSYSQTTTIKKPACVGIRGQGACNTIFNWTPRKGTALVLADVGGTYPQEEVSDLQLNGASNSAATIGIYLGGDPAGVISPKGSFAEHQNFNRVNVRFFGTGVQWGNNAFDNSFSQSVITNNGTGIFYPGNVTGSGESISFFSTSIQNNIVMGINLTGYSDFYFYGSRCDYNATCGLIDGAATAHFFGTHFEQGSNTFLTLGNCCGDPRLNVYISGGQIVESSPTGTDNQIINVLAGSASSRALTMEGTEIIVLHPNTNFVTWSATGSADILNISGIYNTSPTAFTNIASNCAFSRCSIRKVKLSNKVSPSSVAANTCASQDMVFPGIQGTDNVISISSGAPQPGLAVISGKATPGIADHVAVMFCNVTAATIFPTPGIIYTAFLEQ